MLAFSMSLQLYVKYFQRANCFVFGVTKSMRSNKILSKSSRQHIIFMQFFSFYT